ncbi:MAG: nucleotide sugar dehydrogenase [Anaerolineaceae bacterium]|nr:nucleotide sugar dehydrogenase [Anaerolineaceae bacterium]
MFLTDLKSRILSRQAKVAVIGLGYVGLPVACMFADEGFDTLGVDIKLERIDKISAGVSPIEGDEPGLQELLDRVHASGRLRATNAYSLLSDCDVVLIDVETPVDAHNQPRYAALRAALQSLAPVLKEGALVIVESTIAPGTMQKVVLPLLSAGSGLELDHSFFLGNCPERVMPGKLLHNLAHLSRVVGGSTPETAETMAVLYSCIVKADLDSADWITAELVKTTENAYRDVQIAFANEVALICEVMGADVWKVRELVNKSPFRNMHLPGAGVGGHCIPKDPWLLAYGVHDTGLDLRVIPAARAVNDSMPHHMADLTIAMLAKAGVSVDAARILVMGYAYLENSDDTRNSPSEALVARFQELGAYIAVHDPFVAGYQGDLLNMAQGCDAVVVMVKHQAYQQLDLPALGAAMRHLLLIDGRKVFERHQAEAAGFVYQGIGQGQ